MEMGHKREYRIRLQNLCIIRQEVRRQNSYTGCFTIVHPSGKHKYRYSNQ